MTALNFQDYYIGRITETDDDANQFWLRFAQPFKVFGGEWLMRASLPVNSFPTPPNGSMETGLGDANVFLITTEAQLSCSLTFTVEAIEPRRSQIA